MTLLSEPNLQIVNVFLEGSEIFAREPVVFEICKWTAQLSETTIQPFFQLRELFTFAQHLKTLASIRSVRPAKCNVYADTYRHGSLEDRESRRYRVRDGE